MQHPSNPLITITTISGAKVTAPLVQWVQALILRLEPADLLELMRCVERAQAPGLSFAQDTIPADPTEWLTGHGKRT